ncbi:SGF29 tudor-like domain-containing protein [Calycina marina]|uniref:SGF29 tudor-like domain-containing protein n=1 Tax=Calycina marina TaxID=1763456 RepID=A0A9P7YUR1_9HELO|nr:SGF29 tudor-like domain-containing protein [Calycina marina]
MSSRSNRAGRGGASRQSQTSGAEQEIWEAIVAKMREVEVAEARAKEVSAEIIALEKSIKDKEEAGERPGTAELDQLGALYRENLAIANNNAEITREQLMENTQVLLGLVTANEASQEARSARPSTSRDSRPAFETFDGPSDSPGPSSAGNKVMRKGGNSGRTSSQPPRDREEKRDKEASAKGSKPPKIYYEKSDKVAFKPNKDKEDTHDWIEGVVVDVVGEGKSRRYVVQDIAPDEVTGLPGPIYRSSASFMVPIPSPGSNLQDFEVGKRVLALYPETTTFYRADVIETLEGGAKVRLLFEDELAGAFKDVERRFVLDHKG